VGLSTGRVVRRLSKEERLMYYGIRIALTMEGGAIIQEDRGKPEGDQQLRKSVVSGD